MAHKHNIDSSEILKQAEAAAEYGCDGGDPIDKLGPWMDRTGVSIGDVDRVIRQEYGNGRKKYDFHQWFTEMMDNLATDRAS